MAKKTYGMAVLSSMYMILIYLLFYLNYFKAGHNLFDFIRFEWFRFKWWTGERPMHPILIWETLMTGYFTPWWDINLARIKDHNWHWSWPVVFCGGLWAMFQSRFWRQVSQLNDVQEEAMIIMVFFSAMMMLFYTLGSASAARYLIIILPCWYLIGAVELEKLYIKLKIKNA